MDAIGARVRIVGGKAFLGREGVVVARVGRDYLTVDIDGVGERKKKKTSLEAVGEGVRTAAGGERDGDGVRDCDGGGGGEMGMDGERDTEVDGERDTEVDGERDGGQSEGEAQDEGRREEGACGEVEDLIPTSPCTEPGASWSERLSGLAGYFRGALGQTQQDASDLQLEPSISACSEENEDDEYCTASGDDDDVPAPVPPSAPVRVESDAKGARDERISVGTAVEVVGGDFVGHRGLVEKVLGPTYVFVCLTSGLKKKKARSSLKVLVGGIGEEEVLSLSRAASRSVATNAGVEGAAVKEEGEDIVVGSAVEVVAGKHVGERGIVDATHGISLANVILPSETMKKKRKSLRVISEGLTEEEEEALNAAAVRRQAEGESTASKRATVKRAPAKRPRVVLDTDKCSEFVNGNPEPWFVADRDSGAVKMGGATVVKFRFGTRAQKSCFLSTVFGQRYVTAEEPLADAVAAEERGEDRSTLFLEQNKYELVAADIYSDGDGAGGSFSKAKVMRYIYFLASAPGIKEVSAQDSLELFGDIAAETPRKGASRMGLLQSTLCKLPKERSGLFFLDSAKLGIIADNSNEGCGFICDEFLKSLLVHNKAGHALAARTFALQVRIIAPKLGIFKGMLCAKKIPAGEPTIQLPTSMLKVGPSLKPDLYDMACLMITEAGLTPTSTSTRLAKVIDGKPAAKSDFTKELSSMYQRLFKGMGLPDEEFEKYNRLVTRDTNQTEHANVTGLADPTGCLPAGTVFATGMSAKRAGMTNIFVTRSPCTEKKDGRVFSLVTSKPDAMSSEQWEFLESLAFGGLIFANARACMKSMPSMTADGDLDGDKYMICWAPAFLRHLTYEPYEDVLMEPEDPKPSPSSIIRSENWLKEMQNFIMESAGEQKDIGELIGKLYYLGANKDINDLDANAFSVASKKAIDYRKHGKPIPLPAHLIPELAPRLHKYLAPI